MSNQHDGTLTQTILAATRTAAGLRCPDLKGFATNDVSRRANQLCVEGRIYRAKLSHKVVRFFDSQERAIDYERRNRRDSAKHRADKSRVERAQFRDTPATETAKTKHYIAPIIRHDPRRQVGPGEEVPSIFRAIPLGATLGMQP